VSERSIELIEFISVELGAMPRTMIIVATRRKHGNEIPSIISICDDLISTSRLQPVHAPELKRMLD
jgi:hypothetical protein